MMRFKRKTKRQPDKFPILDYRRYALDILLYKSVEHYRTWVVFGETIPEDLRDAFIENPKVNLSESIYAKAGNLSRRSYFLQKEFLVQPLIVSSLDFTESDLNLAREDYTLYESEKEADQCPFCRINPSTRFMRILSETCREGTIEKGGVAIPCIHLLWDEDYEPLTFEHFVHKGFRISEGFKRIWRKKSLSEAVMP